MFKNSNMFLWNDEGKFVQDDYGQIILQEKPILSFEYDTLLYYWGEQKYTTPNGGETVLLLSEEQQKELEEFIAITRTNNPPKFPAIDSDGNYLGLVTESDPNFHKRVETSPPTLDDWKWNFENQQWQRVYYYDEKGNLTEKNKSVGETNETPPRTVVPFYFKEDKWILDDRSDMWNKVMRKKLIIDTINMIILITSSKIEDNGNSDDFLISAFNILCEYSEKQGANPTIIQKSKDMLQAIQTTQVDPTDTSALMKIIDAVSALTSELENINFYIALRDTYLSATDLIVDKMVNDTINNVT